MAKQIEVDVSEKEVKDIQALTEKDYDIILEALDYVVKGGGIQVAKQVLPIVDKIQNLK